MGKARIVRRYLCLAPALGKRPDQMLARQSGPAYHWIGGEDGRVGGMV